MSHTRPMLAALLAVALTVTLAHDAAARTQTADEKALAAYRLTMPNVKKAMAVMVGLAEEASRDPKVQELQKLQAQIKAFENKDEITDADQAQLEKLVEREEALDEEIERENPVSWNQDTITKMEAAIKQHPAALRVMTREGITPRDFAMTTMALLLASMAEGFSQGKLDLAKLPAGINPENIKFIRENKAELEAIQKGVAPKTNKNK